MAKKTKPFISLAAPTGIQDVIAGGVRALQNSYNAWQPKPGDTSSVARVKGDGPKALGIVDQLMTGGMVGSFGNVIDPRLGQSLQSRDAAQKQANIQLLKDAGINAAGAAVGYGIGVGIGKLAGAIPIKTNTGQFISNTLKRESVVIHGSPTSGITDLKPFAGSNFSKNKESLFVIKTNAEGTSLSKTARIAQEYAAVPEWMKASVGKVKNKSLIDPLSDTVSRGSVYVGRAKNKNLTELPRTQQRFFERALDTGLPVSKPFGVKSSPATAPNYVRTTTTPVRVLSEVRLSSDADKTLAKISDAVRRAGGRVPRNGPGAKR